MGTDPTTSHKIIHVSFIDHETDLIFATSDLPIERLPASFEAATTLHIKDVDWSVIEARPMTSAEFALTGNLTLVLRKAARIQNIDPSTILFSLPTIVNEGLPPIAPGSSKLGKAVIEIHEDDWRQIEWVENGLAEEIESEISAIRRIYKNERVASGFRQIHLRKAITAPLGNRRIALDDLRSTLGPDSTWLDGLTYTGVAGIATNSFAVRLPSFNTIFGTTTDGLIQRACFATASGGEASEAEIRGLAAFAARHQLMLVDWCRLINLSPEDQSYSEYFNPVQNQL